MLTSDELYSVFVRALRVSEFKDYHEGLVVLKCYIAMLLDVLECKDYLDVYAFWAGGVNAIETILNYNNDKEHKEVEENE